MTIDAFRIATHIDTEAIAGLVNAAYRPKLNAAGWTHESDWVEGDRTSPAQVLELISTSNAVVLLALKHTEIVGCVHVEKEGKNSHIGMFAINPVSQGTGLGKQLLAYAEKYAIEKFAAEKLMMLVLSARAELLAFYLRRGYHRTGEIIDFPVLAGVGVPKSPTLKIDLLEKYIVN